MQGGAPRREASRAVVERAEGAEAFRVGGGAEAPRTLVVDTVGLPQFDYARNVPVLDRMAETLTFPDP